MLARRDRRSGRFSVSVIACLRQLQLRPMEIKLPKKRPDGSFCVEITLRVNTNDAKGLAARITSWLKEWTQRNRYWNWFEENLDFFNDFAEPPTCAERTQESLVVRVEGRPKFTKWWKDWIVLRLLKDLQGQFDEITAVEAFVNCPE
jgi:hypothetical protein